MSLEEALENERKRLAELEERVQNVKNLALTEALAKSISEFSAVKEKIGKLNEDIIKETDTMAEIKNILCQVITRLEKLGSNTEFEREILEKINNEL